MKGLFFVFISKIGPVFAPSAKLITINDAALAGNWRSHQADNSQGFVSAFGFIILWIVISISMSEYVFFFGFV